MKQATTVEEQIKKLKNRGMSLDIGEKKTKEVLSDIGYFRLGFYCFPFETSYPSLKNRKHQYKSNSKISDVIKLYYLDVDLRHILIKYINRIEINIRTNIVYTVSNKYKNSNTWFVDPSVMEKKFIDNFDEKLYTDSFKKNYIIKNHHVKYINDKYAPAWKTLEFFTFGTILMIFKNLKDNSLKQAIGMQYGIRNENVLCNYFDSIIEIRNICAHGGILFDHTLSRPLRSGHVIKVNNYDKNKLYTVIRVIKYILGSISQNRADEMDNEIDTVFKRYENDATIRYIIESCSGYVF